MSEIARARTGARGRPGGRAPHLSAFLTAGEERALARRGAGGGQRIHFTGRLEHSDLPDLLPACEAQVVPSTFPEAFGMVAVEAAACGALPLSARTRASRR